MHFAALINKKMYLLAVKQRKNFHLNCVYRLQMPLKIYAEHISDFCPPNVTSTWISVRGVTAHRYIYTFTLKFSHAKYS